MRRIGLYLSGQAAFTLAVHLLWNWLPKALTENAVTGWIDEQIATAFGFSSPDASWLIPFVLVALMLWGYHAAYTALLAQPVKHQQRKRPLKEMLPTIGVIIGGFIFVASIAWILDENRRATNEITLTLSRYVLPRHLSEDQIKTIAEYLSKFPPHQYRFLLLKNSEEVGSFRVDIQNALTQGGWTLAPSEQGKPPPFTYDIDVREGLNTQLWQTQDSQNRPRDPKNPRADELFQGAFKLARVPISGGGSGSGQNITAEDFQIIIGHRRMDDGDLVGRKQARERARRILEGDEDN